MKRSQYRNKNTQSPSQGDKSLIKQDFFTCKQAQRDTTTAAPAAALQYQSTQIAITSPAETVAIADRPLREFLHTADLHAQQTFLAQVSIAALRDAKQQLPLMQEQRIKLMQNNLERVLQQHRQLEKKYQLLQQQNIQLETQHTDLINQTSPKTQKSINNPPIIQPALKSVQKGKSTAQNENLRDDRSFLNLQADTEQRLRHQQKRTHSR